MNDFEEYIRQSEPHKREKGYAWQTAIGLQAVDGLKPSEYLKEKARQHIEGDITIDEVKQLVDSYYKSKVARSSSEDRTEEADKVSARIRLLIRSPLLLIVIPWIFKSIPPPGSASSRLNVPLLFHTDGRQE